MNIILLTYVINGCILSFSLKPIYLRLSFSCSHKNCSNSCEPILKNNDLFGCLSVQYVSAWSDYIDQDGNQDVWYPSWSLPTECPNQHNTNALQTFQYPRKKCNFDIDAQCLSSVGSWLFRQCISQKFSAIRSIG